MDQNIFTERRTSNAASYLLAVALGILLAVLLIYWGACSVC